MDGWEIDIELRVRKTLHFAGPTSEIAARDIARLIVTGRLDMVSLAKWEPDSTGYGRHPVETVIDGDPQIVAVRRVER